MNYISDRGVAINSSIIEYDIKHANINVSKYYNLYKDLKYLDTLDALPKKDREVKFGLLLRKDPEFSKQLEISFNNIVKEFIEANGLDMDLDIISIKKDAVYVINHKVPVTQFGPVEFAKKNIYHAYINLGRLEFYIGDKIDVKGIGENYKLHQDGILLIIQELINTLESNSDPNEFLSEIIRLYKNKELNIEMYREFNSKSQYTCSIDGNLVNMNDISYELLDTSCDISYNYINVILPLVRLLL
jgi:hypothetical protein